MISVQRLDNLMVPTFFSWILPHEKISQSPLGPRLRHTVRSIFAQHVGLQVSICASKIAYQSFCAGKVFLCRPSSYFS